MRINFYGGPGVGKSTTAAALFTKLRQNGQQAELIQEYVKTWAYSGRKPQQFDYLFILANQLRAEDRLLQAGVKTLVSDSPVLLQCMYAEYNGVPFANELRKIAESFEDAHPSRNFFVKRGQYAVYEQNGRYEDLGQAMKMDAFILQCLNAWNIPYTTITMDEFPRL